MIYLDYNATTPIAPEVVQAMGPYLTGEFGNPSSGYPLGQRAQAAIARAREETALLLGGRAEEVIFTSGATEANNTVLKGVAEHFGRGHIITTTIEHPAVLNPCVHLLSRGFEVTFLPVDGGGRVDHEAVRRAITPQTILISVMHANNETGALQPLVEIGELARQAGVWFHTDAAQSVGKVRVKVDELKVDFLTLAGHKFYAPKGVGALYVRPGAAFTPLLYGAGQEGGRRPGTENVPYLVALGEACRLAREGLERDMQHLQGLRDLLHARLKTGFPDMVLNGPEVERLPNTLNVSFPGLSGAAILEGLPELAASLGAACHSGEEKPSHVLQAMGVTPERARGAVRLSVGRYTNREEVEEAAALLLQQVQRLPEK